MARAATVFAHGLKLTKSTCWLSSPLRWRAFQLIPQLQQWSNIGLKTVKQHSRSFDSQWGELTCPVLFTWYFPKATTIRFVRFTLFSNPIINATCNICNFVHFDITVTVITPRNSLFLRHCSVLHLKEEFASELHRVSSLVVIILNTFLNWKTYKWLSHQLHYSDLWMGSH